MFKPDSETIRSLCSGQVITSPYSIVKELTENCLDAAATIVDVRLEDYGMTRIEVRDTGKGIKKEDCHTVALPHFTSKLKNFCDISKVATYGYRGEALSAICSVASVEMTTKHSSDKIAISYSFDKAGTITQTGTSHQGRGTTFVVTDMFKNLPVRRTYFKGKKGKEQLELVERYIKGMSLGNPTVRFMLRHNKKLIWQHSTSLHIKNSLCSVYGSVADMIQISCNDGGINIEGMLTTTTKSARQPPFYIINKRLVKFKALSKSIKKLYDAGYPNGAILITIPSDDIDVNVEVDKSAVICRNENCLVTLIEQLISKDVLMLKGDVEQSADHAHDDTLLMQDSFNATTLSIDPLETSRVNEPAEVPKITSSESSKSKENVPSDVPSKTSCYQGVRTDKEPPNPQLFSNLDFLADREKTDVELDETLLHKNLAFWDDLARDLGSDEELPAAKSPLDPFQKQKLVNTIQDEERNVPAVAQRLKDITHSKQASIISWSQGNSDFKLEFLSPQPKPSTKSSFVTPTLPKKDNKKRESNNTLHFPEKRRKLSVSPAAKSPKSKSNSFTFNMGYIASCMPHKNIQPVTVHPPRVYEIDNKWFIIWKNKLHAFNPGRAQEVNIYNKLMCSHSLKYGHNLPPPLWELTFSEIGANIFTYLMKCRTIRDDMDQVEFLKERCLTVNGIRLKKGPNGIFLVVNVCDDIPDFSIEDVIETLNLIVEHTAKLDDTNDSDVLIHNFADVRCDKISQYLRDKAHNMSKTFARFKPTRTDVIDLFSNTHDAEFCVHGHEFRKQIWDMLLG